MDLFLEFEWVGVDRMHLAEDWDQWRTFVNMVMNIRVLFRD